MITCNKCRKSQPFAMIEKDGMCRQCHEIQRKLVPCKECKCPQSPEHIQYDGRCSNCHEIQRDKYIGSKNNVWNEKIELPDLVRYLQNSPRLWLGSTRFKYVSIKIDTRDGNFLIIDSDGKVVSRNEIMLALYNMRDIT